MISDANGADNVFGYCGYVFGAEHRIYTVRHRTYLPDHGRWLERDPLYYEASMSLYYYLDRPLQECDWSGLLPPHLRDSDFIVQTPATSYIIALWNLNVDIQQALQEILKNCDLKDPRIQQYIKELVLASVSGTTSGIDMSLELARAIAEIGGLSADELKLFQKAFGRSFLFVSIPLDLLAYREALEKGDQWRAIFKQSLIMVTAAGFVMPPLAIAAMVASLTEAILDGAIAADAALTCKINKDNVCAMWQKQLERLREKLRNMTQPEPKPATQPPGSVLIHG